MRYHSMRPTPNLQIDSSRMQRSAPTCTLSLTSVTASMASSGEYSKQLDSMDVDSVPTISVEVAPKVEGGIPFPTAKRTHSLLRGSTASNLQFPLTEGFKSCSPPDITDAESYGSSELDPPRKRTRTSALLPPPRARHQRRSLTPTNHMSAKSISSLFIPRSLLSHNASPRIENVPTPQSTSPTSPCLAGPSSVESTTPVDRALMLPVQDAPPRTSSLNPSFPWRRRRTTAAELRILLFLYRTLVYGLEMRYPHRHRGIEGGLDGSNDSQARDAISSCLDAQDAVLAQHLKTYLLSKGTNQYMLVVDVNAIAQEGASASASSAPEPGQQPVLRDDGSVDTLHARPHLPLHLYPSATHSVLSYQQLVASLLIRQHLHPNRSSVNTLLPGSGRPKRLPSKLAECMTAELDGCIY